MVLNHTFLAGEGVTNTVNVSELYVGNKRLFQRLGLYEGLPEEVKETLSDWGFHRRKCWVLSLEGDGIVCVYSVADAVRPEAK
jgi:cation transport ATPase